MLRLIVMDEAHIRVQHGTRRHTCAQGWNFWCVYGNQPCDLCPRHIVLTATFPSSHVWLLSTCCWMLI
jgi:hypothetical protein